MKTAVIGVGNMGSKYAGLIQNGQVPGLELAAITRVRDPYRRLIAAEAPIFESSNALFDSLEKGKLALDAVIIATPHYSHEEIAVRAFRNGLHVLSDKPSGVYSRQARLMEEAADAAGNEGRKSLLISNAAYLSSWKHRMIEIPEIGSAAERAFGAEYEEWLKRKVGKSIRFL